MAVTFVLGRAGAGKTRHCLDSLGRELQRDEDRRLLLLVPEQASFQMERAVVAASGRGGYWRAEVLSFSRLAARLLGETGVAGRTLRPTARAMVLRVVARDMGDRVARAFGRASRTAGFFLELDRVIEELIAEGITPAALAAAAETLPDAGRGRIEILAEIYARYLDWLGEGRLDAAAHLSLLCDRIVGLPWLADASIWVDGFAGFKGQELATLVALAAQARDVTITLLLDPDSPVVRDVSLAADDLSLFARTEETYRRLRIGFADAGVSVGEPRLLRPATPPRFEADSALAILERGLSAGADAPAGATPHSADSGLPAGHGGVRVLECMTRRDELREAARFIRRSIIESNGGLRFSDFAVIARELEPISEPVADVFEEYGIPYFLDRRRAMKTHPLCRLMAALLAVVRDDFPAAATARLLRTGLTAAGRVGAERIDALISRYAIRGQSQWCREAWDFSGHPWARNRRVDRRLHPKIDAVRRRIGAALSPLADSARSNEQFAAKRWAEMLVEALRRLGARSRLASWIQQAQQAGDWEAAQIHRRAWESLCGVLEDMHACLGDMPLDIGDVQDVLLAALREQTLGLAPPTLDQVLVSSIERSRHPDVRFAWLVAFNEGVFPARPREDALLSDAERIELSRRAGWSLRVSRDDALNERLLAYIAVTRPSRGLTISYAIADRNGEPLELSPLLYELRLALPALRVERPAGDEPPVCVEELARDYVRASRSGAAAGDETRRATQIRGLCERLMADDGPASARFSAASTGVRGSLSRRPITPAHSVRAGAAARDSIKTVARPDVSLSGRLKWLLRGLEYDNQPGALPRVPAAADLKPGEPAWCGSPSELESFIQCPFKHFSRYRLKLDDEPGPQGAHRLLGEIAHDVLATTLRGGMSASRGDVRMEEKWLTLLDAALTPWRGAMELVAASEPGHAFMLERLAAFLREVVAVHARRRMAGALEPAAFELEFGGWRGGDAPASGRERRHDSERGVREQASGAQALGPLRLKLADGAEALVRGKIDRVDGMLVGGRERLVVYDYKSAFARRASEVMLGQRLQMYAYALALMQNWASEWPVDVCGGLIAPLRPNCDVIGRKYFAEAGAAEQHMHLYKPRGEFVDEAAGLMHAAAGEAPSPVIQLRITKKEGKIARRESDAVPAEEFERRLALAERTLARAAAGIVSGDVSVSPLLNPGRMPACMHCAFRSVCRYDRAYNNLRDYSRALPRLDEIRGAAEAAR